MASFASCQKIPEPYLIGENPPPLDKLDEIDCQIIYSLLDSNPDIETADKFLNDGLTYYLKNYTTNVTIDELFNKRWKHYELLLLFFMFQYTQRTLEVFMMIQTGERTGFTESNN